MSAGQAPGAARQPAAERLAAAVAHVLPSVRAHLERLVRIPSVSADSAAAPHLAASAGEVAALLRAAGLPEVEVVTASASRERARAPAGAARRPDGAAVRAPRRAATGRRSGLGRRPVQPGRTGRPPVRPRRRRRQGRHRGAPGRAARPRRPAPGRGHGAGGGRGGDRLARADGVPRRLFRPDPGGRACARRLDQLGGRRPRADHLAARRGQRHGGGAHPAAWRAQRRVRWPGPRRTHRSVPAAGDPA